ncbi:winged helix-turn-helix transcriptional regulator [Bacillus sp. RAR_GA_16]|uniref:winged helix-turn-helix transcriptional regulator n=1 Tax=Bacillus sp. RAR_GA_16 TaxID=2876774 RepID=UPI001CCA3BA3|nr:helix-turn-helix domain-containing protein [Bacillus sp. RAR_GA_16]MCA0170649.1 helix-turn-helix transcriptional regulator [Bacillus sp. RAR_GA_16]
MQNNHYALPVEVALEVLGGKWKMIILCHLRDTIKRTSELKKVIPGISYRMLTQQLKELEEDGVVVRKSYNQIPPKVEYYLSDYGKTLRKILDSLDQWGEMHIEKCSKEHE